MAANSSSAIRYVSDSGFPLQIAVQHAVEQAQARTRWGVQYVEHAWVHPHQAHSGFIDLVLFYGPHRFVVECKRQREATWVFMHHSGKAERRRHFRPWVTDAPSGKANFHAWAHAPLDPDCPEATFCAIRGQTSADKNTLLERTCSELVLATEALAFAERDFRPEGRPSINFYYPLLVTTAELKFASFDPGSISLQTGELVDAVVEDVPFVRFRKQLAAQFKALTPQDLPTRGDPSYSMENSVFVVRADYLTQFLTDFERPEEYRG